MHHTINFIRPINQEMVAGLQHAAMSAVTQGATAITIYFSSEGGNLAAGFTAYHLLRSLPVELTTHCIGSVESVAVPIFLAGDSRLSVAHGKFNIHPLNWGFNPGQVDHNRLVEFGESLDFDLDRYASIFDERTQGATQIIDVRSHLSGKAKILRATEAQAAGLIHGIADARIPLGATRWWV